MDQDQSFALAKYEVELERRISEMRHAERMKKIDENADLAFNVRRREFELESAIQANGEMLREALKPIFLVGFAWGMSNCYREYYRIKALKEVDPVMKCMYAERAGHVDREKRFEIMNIRIQSFRSHGPTLFLLAGIPLVVLVICKSSMFLYERVGEGKGRKS